MSNIYETLVERGIIAQCTNEEKVKEILTPDQYVVFLENMVTHQQPAFGPRHHRHGKKGHHQAKCDKQGECDQNCKK